MFESYFFFVRLKVPLRIKEGGRKRKNRRRNRGDN